MHYAAASCNQLTNTKRGRRKISIVLLISTAAVAFTVHVCIVYCIIVIRTT